MCKYVQGNGTTWYTCSLFKKKCKYQQYCTVKHQYVLDKCKNCPAYKPNK